MGLIFSQPRRNSERSIIFHDILLQTQASIDSCVFFLVGGSRADTGRILETSFEAGCVPRWIRRLKTARPLLWGTTGGLTRPQGPQC